MAKTNIYLNFQGNAEEAFNCYKSVFKTDRAAPIMRMGDMPQPEGMPPFSNAEKKMVMHVSLPILGGTNIMGTDMLESMRHKLIIGNNTTISLEPDTKEDADRIYHALSQGGTNCVPPHDEFWGYWGVCLDRFGIRWMFNVPNQKYQQ
ncbi:MAG: VOC family protein [Saprospiraceae bacterium]|jgi:PhnB protein|nr:VOC family protein [Saprospiraceae bacterium]